MYLLAVFTLLVSLAGIYVQVISLQAARIASSQTGTAGAMLEWQAAAISMAASIINTNSAAYTPALQASGCSLTYALLPGITRCPSPTNGAALNTYGTITDGSATPLLYRIHNNASGHDECVHLPATCTSSSGGNCAVSSCSPFYDVIHYQFYSVLYKDPVSGQDLVVTFLPAPVISASNPAPGFLKTASGTLLNITASGLLQQLRHTSAPSFTFGAMNASNQLVVTGNTYTLPTAFASFGAATVNGAVAVVNSPDGF